MKRFLALLVAVFVLTACSPAVPSSGAIQTAIQQTSLAQPTLTETVKPSVVPTETQTPSPAPTQTSAPSLTPTVTPDIRILDIDPQKYLCVKNDLPVEGNYYIPNQEWMSIHTNEEVVSGWTVEKGKEYINRTGRIVGWFVNFNRGTRAVYMPQEVYCSVVIYKTIEGARLLTKDYSRPNMYPNDWKMVDKTIDFGDTSYVAISKTMTSGGDYEVIYNIEFTFRNVAVETWGFGLEKDVTHEFVENVARKLYKKESVRNCV